MWKFGILVEFALLPRCRMGCFVEAADRHPVRVNDAFVDEVDLAQLGSERAQSASTRPGSWNARQAAISR